MLMTSSLATKKMKIKFKAAFLQMAGEARLARDLK